jgi:hypothetical protein
MYLNKFLLVKLLLISGYIVSCLSAENNDEISKHNLEYKLPRDFPFMIKRALEHKRYYLSCSIDEDLDDLGLEKDTTYNRGDRANTCEYKTIQRMAKIILDNPEDINVLKRLENYYIQIKQDEDYINTMNELIKVVTVLIEDKQNPIKYRVSDTYTYQELEHDLKLLSDIIQTNLYSIDTIIKQEQEQQQQIRDENEKVTTLH